MSDCQHPEDRLIQLHDDTTYLCRACGIEGYRTKTGKILTHADIDALADEAEQGYDVSKLKDRDR